MRQSIRLSQVLAMLAMVLVGCSHYTPVESGADPVKITLLPVVNESDLPQIIAPLARNLREKLAHSPNWDLVNEASAEARLQLTITTTEKRAMARDPRDTGRPLSFYEELQVEVEWISELPAPWGPDKIILVSSDQILYAQPSLTDSRTSATAGLADRLADKILQRLDWSNIQVAN